MGAAGAIEIVSGLVGPLKDAFKDAGFTPPNVTFTEDEKSLTLIVQGANVTGTHSLNQDFVADFWRGKLLSVKCSIGLWRLIECLGKHPPSGR